MLLAFEVSISVKINQVLLAQISLTENKKFFLAITNGLFACFVAFVSGVRNKTVLENWSGQSL